MNEKYYGNYIGFVISNPAQDPEKRNRAQIWVPSITNTLYQGWNNISNNSKEITEEMINRLRNSLPWAECASPLIGGGAPFFSNSATGITSNSYEETVVDDNPNLDTTPEESVPEGDLAADFSMQVPEVASEDQIPDTPENNAAGSGNDLPPVEPPLPEDDAVVVPSTPTAADQTGEPQTPAQTKPQMPVVGLDYTLQSGAKPPNSKLLKDVLGTVKQVYGPDATIRISSGERSNSTRHRNGNAVDFFVQTRNSDGTLTGVKGDALAPLIQSWIAQGYAAGIGMTIRENGEGNALHFDQTDSNLWAYTGEVINGRNIDIRYNPDKVSSAFKTAVELGKKGEFPSDIDPTALASSDTSAPSVPNDFADANSSVPYGGAGTATGTFSTISHLAKVWVFFYGGDIQRPVYFAQVTDPFSTSQTLQNKKQS